MSSSAGGKAAPTGTTDNNKSSSKRAQNTNRQKKQSYRQAHKGFLNAKVLDEFSMGHDDIFNDDGFIIDEDIDNGMS